MTNQELIDQQDSLRTWRMFVGGLSGAANAINDGQSVYQDGIAMNRPYGYQQISPAGVSVQGVPVTNNQGIVLSPWLIVAGIVGLFMLRK